jgi:hypothetical protein
VQDQKLTVINTKLNNADNAGYPTQVSLQMGSLRDHVVVPVDLGSQDTKGMGSLAWRAWVLSNLRRSAEPIEEDQGIDQLLPGGSLTSEFD